MNEIAVARELLRVAKSLMAMDFPTQDAMDKYLKEHPDADKSNHKVVETKKEEAPEKEENKRPISFHKGHLHGGRITPFGKRNFMTGLFEHWKSPEGRKALRSLDKADKGEPLGLDEAKTIYYHLNQLPNKFEHEDVQHAKEIRKKLKHAIQEVEGKTGVEGWKL